MLKYFYKFFFYFVFSLTILILIILTFNSDVRRKSLTYLINGYNIYMIVALQSELKNPQPNFEIINIKLNKYLDFSNKLANGKSKLLLGIYDAAKIVQAKVINNDDHAKLEKFNKRLVEMDPLMYEAKIWYANSLYSKNKFEKAFEQIDNAIKISPLDPDPYRLGVRIAVEENDLIKLKDYCEGFSSASLGGKQKRYSGNFFTGFNLNKFGLQFSDNKKLSEIYALSGMEINSLEQYEIVPEKPVNANELKLFFSFIPGISINFTEIVIFHNNQVDNLRIPQFKILSRNSFLQDETLIFTKEEDEIINILLNKNFKDIEKILLKFRLNKLGFTNYCEE